MNIHSPYGDFTRVGTFWVFKDSFGQIKCIGAPGAESRTYQTPEQVAQAAERLRVAAEQESARQQAQAEQEHIQAELQRAEAEEQRLAEETARREAPAKLRALLSTSPVLDGTYATGFGPARLSLTIVSFSSGTGALSAKADYTATGYNKRHTNRVDGRVSGDTVSLTVFDDEETTKIWMSIRLQYDGLGRRLAGAWGNGSDVGAGNHIQFDLK